MKASIKHLIKENPNGLLEMKPSLSIPEYRDNYGFGLNNVFRIYESKRSHHSGENWFAFPRTKSLEEIIQIQEESDGDLLVVFIVETIKEGRVYCHLILRDEAFKGILNDRNQHILQVHQMYTKYFTDHIALNMATC